MDTLQERIQTDLRTAMLEKNEKRKGTLRVIMGEFSRVPNLPADKVVTDEQVVKVINKTINAELTLMETSDALFINILKAYLPVMATYEEIREWVLGNVDLDKFNKSGPVIGIVKKHFGSSADGKDIREVVEDIFG